MKAKIYKPNKNVMQSGRAKTKLWVLEYELATARKPEALMGWTASGDTLNQVKIKFHTKEDAIAFAEKEKLEYSVETEKVRAPKARNYGDNFKYIPYEEGKST